MISLYVYSNIINNKMYIGQTKDFDRRHKEHIRGINIDDGCIFELAIQKYGIDNFKWYLFKEVESEEEANNLEIFWIAFLRHFFGRKMVYNVSEGGLLRGHLIGYKHSEKTKNKMSESKKGKPPNNKGKKVSDETRKNMSISFSGNKNSFYGKTHSEEQKRQWSKARGFTFTEQQILAIKNDPRSNLLVSKDYDCGKSTISRIRNDNWKVPLKQ